MKASLRKIISEVIREVVGEIKLRKISIKLFSKSQSSSKDFGTFNITPVISAGNPKIEKIFSESEIDKFELWSSSDSMNIICAEGLLKYRFADHSDYDGPSFYEELDIDTMKEDDWNLIKERIKPVLDQSDIDEAIREIGKLKKQKLQYKGDNKTLKQKMSDLGIVDYRSVDAGSHIYISQFKNGKWGLYNFYRNKMIIPASFDSMHSIYSKKEIRAIKGDDVFIFNIYGNKKLKRKYKMSDFLNKLIKDLKEDFSRDYVNGKSIEDIEMTITSWFERSSKRIIKGIVEYLGGGDLEFQYVVKNYKEVIRRVISDIKSQNQTTQNQQVTN